MLHCGAFLQSFPVKDMNGWGLDRGLGYDSYGGSGRFQYFQHEDKRCRRPPGWISHAGVDSVRHECLDHRRLVCCSCCVQTVGKKDPLAPGCVWAMKDPAFDF